MKLADLLWDRYRLVLVEEARAGGSKVEARFVRTDRGSFYVRAYDPVEVEHRRAVDALLRSAELPFAVPLATPASDGSLFVARDGRVYALFEQLPGSHVEPSAATASALGESIAHLHRALPERPVLPPAWRDAFAPLELPPDEAVVLADLRARFEDAVAHAPRGTIHGDLIFENTLFEDGAVRSVLDFDTMRVDAFVRDLAVALAIEAYDAEGSRTGLWDPIVAGYGGVRSLSNDERALIEPLVVDAALDGWRWELETAPGEPDRAERYRRIAHRVYADLAR